MPNRTNLDNNDFYLYIVSNRHFCFADPSRIEVKKSQVNVELVKRIMATNIYVDKLNQPRSSPLLLRYNPQIGSFLKGPTIPKSQEVRVESTVLFVAPSATTNTTTDVPDLISTGQVSEIAPSINPFKLMGKAASPSEARKNKGKGKAKGTRVEKKGKKSTSQLDEPKLFTPDVAAAIADQASS